MMGGDSAKDSLIRVPGGKRDLYGIPFVLGPEDLQSKAWVVLSAKSGPTAAAKVEIPLGLKAPFLCLASFCDFDQNEDPGPGEDVFQRVGERLADLTLIYDDGGTNNLTVRRRDETPQSEPAKHSASPCLITTGGVCSRLLTGKGLGLARREPVRVDSGSSWGWSWAAG